MRAWLQALSEWYSCRIPAALSARGKSSFPLQIIGNFLRFESACPEDRKPEVNEFSLGLSPVIRVKPGIGDDQYPEGKKRLCNLKEAFVMGLFEVGLQKDS